MPAAGQFKANLKYGSQLSQEADLVLERQSESQSKSKYTGELTIPQFDVEHVVLRMRTMHRSRRLTSACILL